MLTHQPGKTKAPGIRATEGFRLCLLLCLADRTVGDGGWPEILKSMIDAIEGDIKGVSAAQAQLVEFAGRMNTSQKAIITIQKIHRTMCVRNPSVRVEAGEGGIPTLLKRVEPRSNPWDQH
jgi:hypothetical protein